MSKKQDTSKIIDEWLERNLTEETAEGSLSKAFEVDGIKYAALCQLCVGCCELYVVCFSSDVGCCWLLVAINRSLASDFPPGRRP